VSTILKLLDTVWDEDELITEINRVKSLIKNFIAGIDYEDDRY